MKTIVWLLTTAVSVAAAAWLIEGIRFDGATSGSAEFQDKAVPLLIVSMIIGLVTKFVEPVVKFFSFPFIILTVGLFLLIINAWMLMLTGWIAGKFDVGFHVDNFWAAFLGALVITLVSGFIDVAVIKDDD